jgi:hypothetical protein
MEAKLKTMPTLASIVMHHTVCFALSSLEYYSVI